MQTVIDWLKQRPVIEGATDPQLYDFRPYRDRAKIAWPDGKQVAVWVSPNLAFYKIDPPANPADDRRAAARDRQRGAADWRCVRLAGGRGEGTRRRARAAFSLTPYISGLPYRIAAVEAMIADPALREESWFVTAGDLVDCWRA